MQWQRIGRHAIGDCHAIDKAYLEADKAHVEASKALQPSWQLYPMTLRLRHMNLALDI